MMGYPVPQVLTVPQDRRDQQVQRVLMVRPELPAPQVQQDLQVLMAPQVQPARQVRREQPVCRDNKV